MNVHLVYTLLAATDEQPRGFLNVSAADQIREVELMAKAGLVDASLGSDNTNAFAVINRVTDLGRAFLRASRASSHQKQK